MGGFDISQLGLALNPKLMQMMSSGTGSTGMGLMHLLSGGNPFGSGQQVGAPQPTGAPSMPRASSSAAGFAPMLLSQLMGR